MAIQIITKNTDKTFEKEVITISSQAGDVVLKLGFEFALTVQYDRNLGKCTILNQFGAENFLFKGQTLQGSLDFENMCKIMVKNSDDFISIKLTDMPVKIAQDNITEQDIEGLYGKDVNANLKLKLEKRKAEIEEARVAIIKKVGYKINDFKSKISMNSKTGIVLHIALLLASFILSFGVCGYLTGLPLKDAASVIQMPVNLKLIFIYAAILYGVGLVLKQGVYLSLQEKNNEEEQGVIGKITLLFSLVLYVAIYVINLLYYIAPSGMKFFAIFISLFFTLITILLAFATGYLKFASVNLKSELNKYEYREDFEKVTKEYGQWIERYINNLTPNKIKNIQDKQFMLQIKSLGEIALGIITSPFLAYGVSNTLAMCFPEAAGWVRVSGLRFSPVFLVLATFMIIFAFFAFANAFKANKKMLSSNVLKNDGFTNYLDHGVEIYGLEGTKKLDFEMRRSFVIGLCIIIIEFSMNVSYFGGEIGGDLSGMLLSFMAALVPTALLIAETYMLSGTLFEMNAVSDLLSMREE